MKNLVKFADLKWIKDEDGGIYAKPEGLRWSYYIFPLEDGHVELYLFDSFDNYHKELSKTYPTLREAQEKSSQHYISTLSQFILLDKELEVSPIYSF